jgi:uncharacterized membrane protein
MALLLIALASFVGSHLLMSHALRPATLRAFGERGSAGVYSLVSFATLGWSVWAFRSAPSGLFLWFAPQWAWIVAAVTMLFASILFVGSVTAPNPALMGAGGTRGKAPQGVQRITRHPMMWAFALWAAVHAFVSGDARTVALCFAIGLLALVGARFQDGKKRDQMGGEWAAHEAQTSFVPFGRPSAAALNPGPVALIGGIALFALATWAHPYVGGPSLWSMIA